VDRWKIQEPQRGERGIFLAPLSPFGLSGMGGPVSGG